MKVWNKIFKRRMSLILFQDHKNVVTIYKFTATIRYQVFNEKQTVQSIEIREGQPLINDIYSCNCENSEFYDPDHSHIITGDLHLIKNQTLRKLITKGPNFREPQLLREIDHPIEDIARSLRLKQKLEDTAMDLWVNKVKEKSKTR